MSDKIDSFDKPFSGHVGRVLTDAEGRIEAFQRELEDVKKEVDKATRKLAVWYQRKKQLREIDPINFAAPVALTSEEVKKKHEAFKEVTAVYIREAETLILNPEDQKQSKKVAELIADRRQKMTELGDAVKAAVEKEISEADQHVAELALSRDHIELNLQTAKRDVSYAKVLMSADEGAKSRLREDMVREINSAKAELDSLTQLVPPSFLKKAPTSGSRSPFSDAAG